MINKDLLLLKSNSENIDFQNLVAELDVELKIRDGEDHAFYSQFNKINNINHVIIAYQNNIAVGCGAYKFYSEDTAEIKRMYVKPNYRNYGIASCILLELEKWAKENNFQKCILETGINQPEAIYLYKKNNFQIIENYGQYKNIENSICFEKKLII